MMHCFRCKSTRNLSLKKTDRNGNMTFMCKACRSEEYQRRKEIKPVDTVRHNYKIEFDADNWHHMARERHQKLADKYRPCDAFLKSRGIV